MANKILTKSDRTPKERRDMADYYATTNSTPKTYQWVGKDMFVWTFEDGSQLMMVYDEDLQPLEFVEV